MADLEKLRKLINNFPSRSSDVRFQKQLYDEIFNVLYELSKQVKALEEAPH